MKVSSTLAAAAVLGASAVSAQCPTVNTALVNNARLPDPFTFTSGAKVTTQSDWQCRRNEILRLFDQYELGALPGKPSSVTGSYSGNTLTVNVSNGGRSISFTASISRPSGVSGNVPAIISYGPLSIARPSGNVAIIQFDNGGIAEQTNTGSRGRGKFYDLYGSTHSAGALTAWAWGVSRIIDALETTPAAGIDATRVGVTGCSRNGKGAMVAGALEPRLALTIPQESGAGGAACWRISDSLKSQGQNIQTASQIITENVWFSPNFNANVNRVTQLPFDHHMLAGLIAPRGLYVTDNNIDWLGPRSGITCMAAAQKIYQALGVTNNIGYSLIGGHNHCSFPSGQNSELNAFVQKFLLNQSSANTNVFRSSAGSVDNTWIPWTTPTLGSGGNPPVTTTRPPVSTTTTTTTTQTFPTTTDPSVCTVTFDPDTVTITETPTVTVTVPADAEQTQTTQPPQPTTQEPPRTTTQAPPTGNCAAKWGQCGGQGWTGATCCQSGSTCRASNQWYSQCL
ncbi:carbohydrate-binding module 1 [Rhizophlyctis rosea]|uniref:(4-O-methyl)-D-glucuronate--lignin esterase n=1 Tax=Rhizophlyctis rosea TaxID=64517 RepID=A0AAD5S599_9FUNG|nr:carbohydrate-binding module 1 [Rhizophlyctis rosea]